MKKILWRNLFAVVLVVIMIPSTFVCATVKASDYIDRTKASTSATGNGKIKVSFEISGNGKMTEIGVSKIVVYTSSGDYVDTYRYTDSGYETMMGSNRYMYSSSITFVGTSGQSYYFVVTFYAGDSSGSDTNTYITNTIRA